MLSYCYTNCTYFRRHMHKLPIPLEILSVSLFSIHTFTKSISYPTIHLQPIDETTEVNPCTYLASVNACVIISIFFLSLLLKHFLQTLILQCNTLPILWLRYNPNVYRENGIKQLIRQYEREEVLVDFMRNWNPGSDMEIKYFYYNLADGELEIHRNDEYDNYFKTLCI